MGRGAGSSQSEEISLPDVVVVESSAEDAAAIVAELRARAHRVRVCTSVHEALAEVRAAVPDVVIAELLGPTASEAVALAVAIRRDKTTRHVGLIAMSHDVEPHWSIVQRFDVYLRKPTDLDLLASVVERLTEVVRHPLASKRQNTPT